MDQFCWLNTASNGVGNATAAVDNDGVEGVIMNNAYLTQPQPIVSDTSTSTSAKDHRHRYSCPVCNKSYHRPDHVQRHLKIHANVRPFKCTLCSRNFNRNDMLTRHKAKHERDAKSKSKTPEPRLSRATKSCQACAASKSRCDERKPCTRCSTKNLQCISSPSLMILGQSEGISHSPPVREPNGTSPQPSESSGPPQQSNWVQPQLSIASLLHPEAPSVFEYPIQNGGLTSSIQAMPALAEVYEEATTDDNSSLHRMQFQPDLAFNFDTVDFHSFHSLFQGGDIGGAGDFDFPNPAEYPEENVIVTGLEVFKHSPWLWTPNSQDHGFAETDAYAVNEDNPETSPGRIERAINLDTDIDIHPLDNGSRDALLCMAAKTAKTEIPSRLFPSTTLFNILVRAFFIRELCRIDSWMHAASFKPHETRTELLGAIIAAGSNLIAVPTIWKMGLAMQETVRVVIHNAIDTDNRRTRDIQVQQTYMLWIELGLWSGIPRKMEIAEAFGHLLMTIFLRSGAFSHTTYPPVEMPTADDDAEQLKSKWEAWTASESRKRLAIQVFLHSIKTAIALTQGPLVSISDLSLPLPASRDLWFARTAEEWRSRYLRKRTPLHQAQQDCDTPINIYSPAYLDAMHEHIDAQLSILLLFHGYWGQISTYHTIRSFHHKIAVAVPAPGTSTQNEPFWLTLQYQELYRDLSSLSTRYARHISNMHELTLLLELLMMSLHISFTELHCLAGKMGEAEAGRAAKALRAWRGGVEGRRAVWHAGQILRAAKAFPGTGLCGFHAVVVYQACLTLWAYGRLLLCHDPRPPPNPGGDQGAAGGPGVESPAEQELEIEDLRHNDIGRTRVILDSAETAETRAFLNVDYGVPGLTSLSTAEFVELRDLEGVMRIGQEIFHRSFPDGLGHFPPLMQSLDSLMRGLGRLGRRERGRGGGGVDDL